MQLEERYAQLKALAASVPDLGNRLGGPPDDEATLRWLGRLGALMEADGDLSDIISLRTAPQALGSALGPRAKSEILNVLYRALAACELELPSEARGAYILVGQAFDAVTALRGIFSVIKRTILIVDAYMNERVLTDFAPLAPEGVDLALLTDQSGVKPALYPTARAWQKQYGQSRALSIRVTAPRALHDRLILGDEGDAWILTQSLKDFATRSPASIQKADTELAKLKFEAYSGIWNASSDPLAP